MTVFFICVICKHISEDNVPNGYTLPSHYCPNCANNHWMRVGDFIKSLETKVEALEKSLAFTASVAEKANKWIDTVENVGAKITATPGTIV